jgi:hypothetical protein
VEPNCLLDSKVFVSSHVYTPSIPYTPEECTLIHVGECRGGLPPLRGPRGAIQIKTWKYRVLELWEERTSEERLQSSKETKRWTSG